LRGRSGIGFKSSGSRTGARVYEFLYGCERSLEVVVRSSDVDEVKKRFLQLLPSYHLHRLLVLLREAERCTIAVP